jgi:hypothetical protein
MKLRELKHEIDNVLEGQPKYYNPDVGVVVSTGTFPSTPQVLVTSANMGFDWDTNFMIRTDTPLIPKKSTPLRDQIEEQRKEINQLKEQIKHNISND